MTLFLKRAAAGLFTVVLLAAAVPTKAQTDKAAKAAKAHQKRIQSKPFVVVNDTLFHNGKAYCIMKEFVQDQYHPDYSIRSLDNRELVYIQYATTVASFGAYHVRFLQSGNSVKLRLKEEKEFPKLIVENGLVTDGQYVDPKQEEGFIIRNGGYVRKVGENASTDYSMVTRNRSASVMLIEKNILQDTNKVGVWSENGYYEDKAFKRKLIVMVPTGAVVAEADYADAAAETANVNTSKDGKRHTVPIQANTPARKQIIEWLIANEYL